MNNQKKFIIALNLVPQIGPKRINILMNYFGDLKKVWESNASDFKAAGLDKGSSSELERHIKLSDPEKEAAKLERLQIKTVSIDEAGYPKRLKEIYLPPPLLYYKGTLEGTDENSISIVGARKVTSYGKEVTKAFAYDLASMGITIVSGLALGVDTEAHQAALNAKGRTIAVLGCGVDKIYPYSNINLAKKIIENGAVLSEYPPGTEPLKQHFPARNRIIAGLSLGTLVTEASEKSGSLITAGFALEQGKEIFAIPGNIYNINSAGPNNLIKMGAKAVSSAQDILNEFGLENIKGREETKKIFPSSPEEEKILRILETEPQHIDVIIKESCIEARAVSSTITIMELKGKLKHLGGMVYRINN